MKNFSKYALVAIAAFTMGQLFDSYMMANDEEFHDYWMKRSKKKP